MNSWFRFFDVTNRLHATIASTKIDFLRITALVFNIYIAIFKIRFLYVIFLLFAVSLIIVCNRWRRHKVNLKSERSEICTDELRRFVEK